MPVLVPVAEGSESLETVSIVNVLRRGAVETVTASIETERLIAGTRSIPIMADALWSEIEARAFDAIILPGGETGARRLAAHAGLMKKLHEQRIAHHWYGGICAAPALVLSPAGLLDGKQATCHPAFRQKLIHYVDRPVVVDGHCVTSQGAGTAIAFGLRLLHLLRGPDLAREVANSMVAPLPD
jgi:4-methyl-5(b-hydroxyethyl)-thiazole monophosphate biosynthesis